MPPPPPSGTVRCEYCATPLAPSPAGWRSLAPDAQDFSILPGKPRLWLGGRRYVLLGRLARGESTDAFLARRDARLDERVVIRVLRDPKREVTLTHEATVLRALLASDAQGATHFSRLLPQLVAHGRARLGEHGHEGDRVAIAHRWRSGFAHTYADIRRAYPSGVEGGHAVWLWKRVLELLGFVHRVGFVHRAVAPEHLLVHAADHGAVLTGWSRAAAHGTKPPKHPDDTAEPPKSLSPYLDDAPASPRQDLRASARVILFLLGGDPMRAPSGTEKPLATLLETTASAPMHDDAWALKDALDAAAREAFGPPRFRHFTMPR